MKMPRIQRRRLPVWCPGDKLRTLMRFVSRFFRYRPESGNPLRIFSALSNSRSLSPSRLKMPHEQARVMRAIASVYASRFTPSTIEMQSSANSAAFRYCPRLAYAAARSALLIPCRSRASRIPSKRSCARRRIGRAPEESPAPKRLCPSWASFRAPKYSMRASGRDYNIAHTSVAIK
jgi:hypothetical protein